MLSPQERAVEWLVSQFERQTGTRTVTDASVLRRVASVASRAPLSSGDAT